MRSTVVLIRNTTQRPKILEKFTFVCTIGVGVA
jgi:hypothetical protein